MYLAIFFYVVSFFFQNNGVHISLCRHFWLKKTTKEVESKTAKKNPKIFLKKNQKEDVCLFVSSYFGFLYLFFFGSFVNGETLAVSSFFSFCF